ncbi:MAG: pirin family protein [Candidatus Moraniibacteriota bacterium]
MQTIFHPAGSRGYAHHGWLTTHHSFSFADYYDPQKMGFGALRVLNDDIIEAGQGFGRHPHRDMEIITIPLSGALAHKDSMGNAAVIETGEVQVMSAGTGVEHSEFNASQTEAVMGLQIWIVPNRRGAEPRYAQKLFGQPLPRNEFSLVVGPEGGEENGALFIHQDAFLSLGRFDADTDIDYALRSTSNGVYFFVIEGAMAAGSQVLEQRDALGVWDAAIVTVRAKQGAYILAIEVPMM